MKLTKTEQTFYDLRKEGKTLEECAEIMGVTLKSIKSLDIKIKSDLYTLHYCFKVYTNGFFEKLIHVVTEKGFDFALSEAVKRASELLKRSVNDRELMLYFTKDIDGDNVDVNCSRKYICSICGEEHIGYGHNPNPITIDGECCDKCNATIVIPARIKECTKRNVLSAI